MSEGLWTKLRPPELERTFQEEEFHANRKAVRFGVTLSVLAFWAYGLHDALVIPELRSVAWAIRFGLSGPIGLLVIAFVFTSRNAKLHQPMMLLLGATLNCVVLWIGARSSVEGYYLYTAYALVFVMAAPLITRMNPKTQLLFTLLTLALYNGFEALLTHSAPSTLLSLNLTILTLGILGMLAAGQAERQARVAFLQRRVITEQMASLAAERQTSERLLLNVLPKPIADRLRQDPAVIADRFPSASVLFSDIVGFTELSGRLPADEIVKRLNEIFSRFDEIADDLGLEKIKTIGDAYMVAGGIPIARDDHASALCEMALRMRDAVTEISRGGSDTLAVRIGVHTGPIIAGVIGKKKFIYDIWGDTVNIASRMESHGQPGMIQVSQQIYEATKHAFRFELRGTIPIKGKGDLTTYFLLDRMAKAEHLEVQ